MAITAADDPTPGLWRGCLVVFLLVTITLEGS